MSEQLFIAIEQHDIARLLTMLESGLDIDVRHPRQPSWSPLMVAIDEVSEGGPIEAVVLLLRFGASVEGIKHAGGHTPLTVAVQNNELEIARLLLASGADANIRTDVGDSPLRLAVEQSNLPIASLLLHCGATRTIDDFGGLSFMTAPGRAVKMLNLPMIELLLRFGASPTHLDGVYRPASYHVPQRDASNAIVWDAVVKTLTDSSTAHDVHSQ